MTPTRDNPASSSPITIRASAPEDAEAINRLVNLPGFRHGTLRLPFTVVATTRKWLDQDSPDRVGIVALRDGEVVGMAGLQRDVGRQRHSAGLGMGVHDAHVGTGVGTALLAALVDAADNWLDVRRLHLTVFVDNVAGLALYRRFGFVEEGRHRAFAFRNGAYVDALCMARLRGIG